ncbi:MAG TPA: glutamate-cysteine ligase family protein [Methanothrix sp.]
MPEAGKKAMNIQKASKMVTLKAMPAKSPIGTEHEYSINDKNYRPLAISDKILQQISGEVQYEVPFGGIRVAKELQKHVLELIPATPGSLSFLEENLYHGLCELYRATNYEYGFLGLGMHPLLTLDQTTYWDHDEQEYYQAYDRLFNIRQHGWLNIQALQINYPYESPDDLVTAFNKIRSLIPYLVAVSASSPLVEGETTSYMDNRLVYYRQNQAQIPEICHSIIPEKLDRMEDYVRINQDIYEELKKCRGEILCHEWVNSRGVIVRFTRKCLEVKAIDEQECLHSDMAFSAFLLALLRSDLELEEEESHLLAMLEDAMRHGVAGMRPELEKLLRIAQKSATKEEMRYLPVVAKRIEQGSLAEVMAQRLKEGGEIEPMLAEMEWCLKENRPYYAEPGRCG